MTLADAQLDGPLVDAELDALLRYWDNLAGADPRLPAPHRLIRKTGSQVLYVAGPGHGGPALVANVSLEGTYSEVYPHVSADEPGLLALVRQFSTPGGIPSRVSVPTPDSTTRAASSGTRSSTPSAPRSTDRETSATPS